MSENTETTGAEASRWDFLEIFDFLKAEPQRALAIQTFATSAAKDMEHHMADLPGEKKKELVTQQILDYIAVGRLIYDGVDLFANIPGPLDTYIKDQVIPWAVEMAVKALNDSGIFTPKEAAQ